MKKNQLFLIRHFGAKAMVLSAVCLMYSCSEKNSDATPQVFSPGNKMATEISAGTRLWTSVANTPWQDRFENFNTEDNGGTTPTLTSIADATYTNAWRVIKPAGAKRAEMSRAKGYSQQEGETIDLNYAFKFNPQQDIGSSEIAVFQWKSEDGATLSRQNYPFNFTYKSGKLILNTFGPGDPYWNSSSVSSRKNTIWSGNLAAGAWVNIGLRIKVSRYTGTSLSSKGFIELWINGAKQTLTTQNSTSNYDITLSSDGTRAYHRTNDGAVTYPKWGVYNEDSRPYEIRALFARMTIDRL